MSPSPLWRNDEGLDRERFNWCVEIVKRECQRHGNITLVDGFSLIPNVDECFCDRLHPNEYGCLLLAEKIFEEMKKLSFKRCGKI